MFVHGSPECLAQGGEIIPDKPDNSAEEGKYSQLMRLKAAHLLALFLLVYIGVEVTIGGGMFNHIPYNAI
jgi:fucose permease